MEHSLSILAKGKSICHKIITGDINIDLIKFEFHTSTGDYLEMLMQNGFLPTVLLPTRVTNRSCTLIDQYNTRHKRDFHAVPINTTTYGKRTVAYKGRHLWNQLPKNLKETDDTLLFKTELKDEFFKMYN